MSGICLLRAGLVFAVMVVFSLNTPLASQIIGGRATFDSVGAGSNPFERGAWGNARGGSSWAQYDLYEPRMIKSIYIKSAGTDVTSKGSLISIKIKDEGGWKYIYELRDKVINRGFSGGKKGPQVGPIRIMLQQPTLVSAVRLEMQGHGWFSAEDIRLEGP